MKIIWEFFRYLFSFYVNPFEKKIDKYLSSLKENDDVFLVRETVLNFMKENLIVFTLFLEKKFKGYKYLKKSIRRQLYENVGMMLGKFEVFNKSLNFDENVLFEKIKLNTGKDFIFSPDDREKIKYFYRIMDFLKPGRYYFYLGNASFGKLLRNLFINKLEGDCNQIVTLYVYLYSLKYDISELQIKILKDHVCLYFKGIDIEATNATFKSYDDYKFLLPITELISTNLLDISDLNEESYKIDEKELLKCSRFAYLLSSMRQLVDENLKIAYKNLVLRSIKILDFEAAAYYSKKLDDNEIYRDVKIQEGLYYLSRKNFEKAIEIFAFIKDKQLVKSVYASHYNMLIEKVSGVKTIAEAKNFKYIYQKLADIAKKMEDHELYENIKKTLNQL